MKGKKGLRTFLVSIALTLSMLSQGMRAAEPAAQDETPSFASIMEMVDRLTLPGDGKDILKEYFEKYFAEHPEELVEVVNDILQSIDDYSMYMSKEEYDASFGQTLNNYAGIGIMVYQSEAGEVIISKVFSEGPAQQAGLQMGDVIIAVDGTDVTQMQMAEVTGMMRGKAGTPVKVTVRRGEETVHIVAQREMVTPEHVDSQVLSPGISYISVSAMGSMWDLACFYDIWNTLPQQRTRAVILDLRGNGGGLVSMAQRMIEEIVPEANERYMTLHYREDQGGNEDFYTPGGGLPLNQLVILVDGGTASAAELLAGSLSDLGVATLVGTKTYGKGVGQYHLPLKDGSVLIITSMAIELPEHGLYNGNGLVPDLLVEPDDAIKPLALSALDLTKTIEAGTAGGQVSALSERLVITGYLDRVRASFDDTVLSALRRFQKANDMPLTKYADSSALMELDKQANAIYTEDVWGNDAQLAAAVRLCRQALLQPIQYTVNQDGKWTAAPAA